MLRHAHTSLCLLACSQLQPMMTQGRCQRRQLQKWPSEERSGSRPCSAAQGTQHKASMPTRPPLLRPPGDTPCSAGGRAPHLPRVPRDLDALLGRAGQQAGGRVGGHLRIAQAPEERVRVQARHHPRAQLARGRRGLRCASAPGLHAA